VLLTVALASLALLSLTLMLWQFWAAARFPLHQRGAPTHAPPVTLLKPLKGCDAETEACLRSWFLQDYPGERQILFAVASADDPVCPIVRKLIATHPQCDAELMVCAQHLGPNAKVSQLAQVERSAKHPFIVVSDADVRVPPDLLGQLLAPFGDPDVGLVNCLYRLANPSNCAMRWEAFGANADFWSQVLQAQTLKPMDFALGAVMALRRGDLAAIGGFEGLVEYLADDYQLGHRIARRGGRVVLCPVVVECWSAPVTRGEVWRHQMRWARTIRACQPVAYFFSILSNGTLWPLLWTMAKPEPLVFAVAGGCVLVRMLTALWSEWRINRILDFNSLWLAPIKDLLQVAVWALAFAGNHVNWRGQRPRVLRGGRLVRG
jgi:ceramide glucosyltransferase